MQEHVHKFVRQPGNKRSMKKDDKNILQDKHALADERQIYYLIQIVKNR